MVAGTVKLYHNSWKFGFIVKDEGGQVFFHGSRVSVGHIRKDDNVEFDIDEARRIMVEIALNHPDLLKKVVGKGSEFLGKDALANVRLIELTDFAQKLRLYYWAPERSTAIKMKHDLTESIKKRFDSEGIEIPFPYRGI
jgi:cold shock CspA family protein